MEFEAYKLIHSVWAAEEGQEEGDQEKETGGRGGRKRQNESKKEHTTCKSKRIHLKESAGGEIINKCKNKSKDKSKWTRDRYAHRGMKVIDR